MMRIGISPGMLDAAGVRDIEAAKAAGDDPERQQVLMREIVRLRAMLG